MGHIFISYSHKDKDYVHKLQEAIQNEGFEVWIDDRIDFGTTWPKVIQKNLDECDAFIVVMTENAYESEWVQNEVTRAKRKKKPFFALLLRGDTWLAFEAIQYENINEGKLPTKKFYDSIARVTPRVDKVDARINEAFQKTDHIPQVNSELAIRVYEALEVEGENIHSIWEMPETIVRTLIKRIAGKLSVPVEKVWEIITQIDGP